MKLGNNLNQWGAVSKVLHWSIAILIIGTSIFMLHVNDSTWWFKSSPEIFITYIHWHKSFGLLALLLISVRIWWRRRQPVPVTAPLTEFEQRWSHRTHMALYVLMVAVPVTGWLSSSLFGSVTNVFGWFVIPAITPENRTLLPIAYWAHFGLAWAILCLVTFHAGAAFYHHFKRKDRVLKAMLPGSA
jgi:cytochrome b561